MWPLEEPETASWSGGPGARDWRSDVDDQGLASWSGELEARSFPWGLQAPELAILGLFAWLAVSTLIGIFGPIRTVPSSSSCGLTNLDAITQINEKKCSVVCDVLEDPTGGLYDECERVESAKCIFPVYRCSSKNVINRLISEEPKFAAFTSFDANFTILQETGFTEYCLIQDFGIPVLSPDYANCTSLELPPFSTCAKTACPGVQYVGIVGAAVLSTTALAGLSAIGVGGLGAASVATCNVPFCTAPSQQCCLLINSSRGLRCPRSC